MKQGEYGGEEEHIRNRVNLEEDNKKADESFLEGRFRCKSLVDSQTACLMLVRSFPDALRPSIPFVHRWDVSGRHVPWAERRMPPENTLKGF